MPQNRCSWKGNTSSGDRKVRKRHEPTETNMSDISGIHIAKISIDKKDGRMMGL